MKKSAKKTPTKLGATTKRARRVRYANEFDVFKLSESLRAPLRPIGNFAWEPDTIRAARDAQMRGDFRNAARLADAMGTDAGLFTARLNRLAPMRGLPTMLDPADQTARGIRIAAEGEALFGRKAIALQRDHTVSLHRRFVDHGASFGVCVWTPRLDGSRIDVELRVWPQESVRWREWEGAFYAMTRDGKEERIEHGNGRWVVFQHENLSPWTEGCVAPGALVWADRAFAIRDRSNASRSHGNVRLVGEMPANVPLEAAAPDPNGNPVPSAEAAAMLELLETLHVGDLPFGIRPAGSKTELMVNTSQAWQIWNEMIKTNDADAARIYLGQDGTTTNAGGNYIKSERLFGVRNDLVEADIETFAEAILTGVIEPWAAVNFGDSRLAPTKRWLMPDADEDARRTSIGEHQELFFRDIDSMLEQGFVVDQTVVNELAKDYGVRAPKIGATPLRPRGTPPAPSSPSTASKSAARAMKLVPARKTA